MIKESSTIGVLDLILSQITTVEQKMTDNKMVIAIKISNLIKSKGYKLSEFAALLQINIETLIEWLSGTHNFTINELTQASYALNVSIKEII